MGRRDDGEERNVNKKKVRKFWSGFFLPQCIGSRLVRRSEEPKCLDCPHMIRCLKKLLKENKEFERKRLEEYRGRTKL